LRSIDGMFLNFDDPTASVQCGVQKAALTQKAAVAK